MSNLNDKQAETGSKTQMGGHLLVECLVAQGISHAFGVPGESYLAVLDGFHKYKDQGEIPVLGWRPDYTGYDATVRARLARARHDTAEMVSSFINTARVGPGTRTLLELLPSFVLYPFQNRRQGGLTTGDFRANYQNLRDKA